MRCFHDVLRWGKEGAAEVLAEPALGDTRRGFSTMVTEISMEDMEGVRVYGRIPMIGNIRIWIVVKGERSSLTRIV